MLISRLIQDDTKGQHAKNYVIIVNAPFADSNSFLEISVENGPVCDCGSHAIAVKSGSIQLTKGSLSRPSV
jgi:hypothetical protein